MSEPPPVPLVALGGRLVGAGQACFVIAEAGVNHDGRLDRALALVDAAAQAGADAVKFQTFTAARLATPLAAKAPYQRGATPQDESQLEMLQRLELGPREHAALMARCRAHGILFLSSAFDDASADLLEELGVIAFKVPSGELTNHPFLIHLTRKGRPLILSTGMSTLEEVAAAVEVIRREGGGERLILLHCVSDYPAAPQDANLNAMRTLREAFRVPVGYSDHTMGLPVALAAVACGACVLEKHFTLDRRLPGPDHHASLEPGELRGMVEAVRVVEQALGDGVKRPTARELTTAIAARKSLVAATDIPEGTVLTETMVVAMRPGSGLPPSQRHRLVGRRTRVAIPAGTLFSEDMLS